MEGSIYEIYKNLSCGLCEVISLPFSARFWVALAYVLSYDYFISFFSCHDGSTTLPCLARCFICLCRRIFFQITNGKENQFTICVLMDLASLTVFFLTDPQEKDKVFFFKISFHYLIFKNLLFRSQNKQKIILFS